MKSEKQTDCQKTEERHRIAFQKKLNAKMDDFRRKL